MGVYTYGIRSISKIRKEKDKVQSVYTELFLLGLIFNIFFLAFYYLYISFINKHTGEIIYFILMIQFAGSALNVEWMNEAREDYRFILVKSVLIKVLYVASIFTFVRRDNIVAYGMVVSWAYILENIFSFIYITKKTKISIKGLSLKKHLKPLLLIFMITNISLLYAQSDKIMLGLLVSDQAVAVYTIPHYIMTSVYNVVISIIVVSIARLCSLLNEKSKEEYNTLHNELVRSFYMIFIPIIFFIFVAAGDIITLYAAGKYDDSIVPLKIFAWAILFNSMVYIEREGVLYLYEKEKIIITCNLIGGLINFGFNTALYFMGYFNPINAVSTLAFSFLIVAVLMRIFIRRIDKNIELITIRTVLYFLFSLPLIFFDYMISKYAAGPVMRLLLLGGFGIVFYVLLLVISKDRVFINNVKASLKKLQGLKKRV